MALIPIPPMAGAQQGQMTQPVGVLAQQQAQAPQQAQQGGGGLSGILNNPGFGPTLQSIGLSLMSSPSNAPLKNVGSNLQALTTQSMQRRQFEQQEEERELEKQKVNQSIEWLKRNDPTLAAMVEQGGLPVQDAMKTILQRQQGADPTASMREFQLAQQNPEFAEFLGGGGQELPTSVQEYNWYAEQEAAAGRQPVSFLEFENGNGNPPAAVAEYNFYAEQERAAGREPASFQEYQSNNSSGMSIRTNPDGSTEIIQGRGAGKLTEGQSKDAVYATRASGALPLIDRFGSALTDPVQRAIERDPTGLARGRQSPEFQQANQAGLEFLQAILRKDTGAAITSQEQEEYGRVYLPQPGDGPEVLAQKKLSRRRALEALKAGMPPDAILNMEYALSEVDRGSGEGGGNSGSGWEVIGVE